MLSVYKHTRTNNGHDAYHQGMGEEVAEVFRLSGFLQLFRVIA